MKTTITVLLVTIATSIASAPPTLLVQTTITEYHAEGVKDVMAAPTVAVESGKQAVIKVGRLEFAITPTLLNAGTVDLRAILTERDGEKANTLTAPRIHAELGKVAEIKVGQRVFATKTSLAK